MNNAFDEVRLAVRQAREQFRAADSVAYDMAELLRGRLRNVGSKTVLSSLKRELRNFDAVTGKWRNQI